MNGIKITKYIKHAMPVREPTQQQRQDMAKEKIYMLFDQTDVPKPLPHARKTEVERILQDQGIVELFGELSPVTVLTLPKVYNPSQENIVEIEGEQYYLLKVIPSKDPKKSDPKRGLVKGEHYDGKIILVDMDTGIPVVKSFDQYASAMKASPHLREETLSKLNEKIKKHNERIDKINNAVGVSRFPLQLKSVEEDINDRLTELNAQRTAIESKKGNPLRSINEWVEFQLEGVKNGTLSIRDIFDTLLYIYQTKPQELIDGITNGSIPVPDEIRGALIAIAQQEYESRRSDIEQKQVKDVEREERIEEEIPEEKMPDLEHIQELTLEQIPEQKYKEPSEYNTYETWMQSQDIKIRGIDRDIRELTDIKNGLSGIRDFIGHLEKGQRGKAFLKSEQGTEVLNGVRSALVSLGKFISRYSINIVENGNLNPKLMSRKGSTGNAFIAIGIKQLYNVIRETLKEFEGDIPSPVLPEKTPVDTQPEEVEASSKDVFVKKLSNALWSVFERRMSGHESKSK